MKNYDYWKDFARTGRIDDYLNYVACAREDETDMSDAAFKEGGTIAGINYGDGNGPVGHAGWGLR
jgi:hypothetical protein